MADKQTVEAQIDEIIRELTGIDEFNDNDLYKKQASVKAQLNQLLIKELKKLELHINESLDNGGVDNFTARNHIEAYITNLENQLGEKS